MLVDQPKLPTRLWQPAVRFTWLLLLLFAAGSLIASLPPGYTYYLTICRDAYCPPEQLTPEGLQTLQAAGLSSAFYAAYNMALGVIVAVVFGAMAVLLVRRQAQEPVAWFTSVMLIIFGIFVTESIYSLTSYHPAWMWVVDLFSSLGWVLFVIFTYIFPDGRFVPGWAKWAALLWIAVQIPYFIVPTSPYIPGAWPPFLQFILYGGFFVSCFVAQIHRYRHVSNPLQKQQTKWVLYSLTVFILILTLVYLPEFLFPGSPEQRPLIDLAANTIEAIAICLVPLAIALSILRYRLWDIDLIIRRTLIYSTLSITLGLIYFISVGLLQNLFMTLWRAWQQQAASSANLSFGETQISLVTVLSTLLIARLFSPVRRGVQTTIDRRFYRRKYDAEKALAAFAATARDEVDLEALSGELLTVVQRTLQPAHVSLWLNPFTDRTDPGPVPPLQSPVVTRVEQ